MTIPEQTDRPIDFMKCRTKIDEFLSYSARTDETFIIRILNMKKLIVIFDDQCERT